MPLIMIKSETFDTLSALRRHDETLDDTVRRLCVEELERREMIAEEIEDYEDQLDNRP